MNRQPIIIDCDPGQDDAVAIFLALASPQQLRVLGITTVAGNVPLAKTQRNARIVCEWAGRPDLDVFAGCERPLLRSPVCATEVHGEEGLSGPALHQPTMPLGAGHAVDYLVDTLRSHPGRIALCALGPLTNIAVALAKAPDIAPRIQEIVLMGGAMSEGGNVTPCAEFNFHADPHAAKLVLESGVPITMLPLDATHQVMADSEQLGRLGALGNRAGTLAAQLLQSHGQAEKSRFADRGSPLHDPCVVAYLLAPHLFSSRMVHVAVEVNSALTLGASVVDWWGTSGRRPNVRYVNKAHGEGVLTLLCNRLSLLP